MLIQSLFWFSLLFILYVYVLYPLIIKTCSYLFGTHQQPQYLKEVELPTVSLVIAAYNEEQVIEQRIMNALELDYPSDKLEIIIATDGCTDKTIAIANNYSSQGISVLIFESRRGKPSVINDTIKKAQGDIIVMSDANTMMNPNVIKTLVRWFRDPTVGTVCGCLKLIDPTNNKNADGIYWTYENEIKKSEGKLRALLGANGAIYAIRREIVPVIPSDTLIDDFTIPLLAKIKTGAGIVYDETAIAYEESSPNVKSEFYRRVRISSGGAQAVTRLATLLSPRYGWTCYAFLSHKIMRWASPFFLLIALITNAMLLSTSLYTMTFSFQLLFYSFCFLGNSLNITGTIGRIIRVANLFVYVNIAVLIGTFKWLTIHQSGMWDRTARSA
ncbi:MAG: glycosyl transferase family 2 [Blastopirellula sp.]|nr:MAG: glycosyl transferase family 2 [Blastopirellula sp.]